ncbi:MAG: hypothetical protein O9353_07415 [Bacteroidia bacterium]|nr:hypothetical protein [Bacteroidia bacterium]
MKQIKGGIWRGLTQGYIPMRYGILAQKCVRRCAEVYAIYHGRFMEM